MKVGDKVVLTTGHRSGALCVIDRDSSSQRSRSTKIFYWLVPLEQSWIDSEGRPSFGWYAPHEFESAA